MQCSVCDGTQFTRYQVLWEQLVNDWQLSPVEAAYVNRQQGENCNACGSNLRSIALADALRAFMGSDECLRDAATSSLGQSMSILEINEAGMLTPVLKTFGKYTFGAYPEVDMHAIPYGEKTFDIVIHSDTLEHIPNPIHALAECYRVLKPGGALCFTVPVIVGRMSRNRDGLAKSFHGNSATLTDDYAVQTEFGADAWTYVLQAGFADVSIHAVEYPAALAFLAKRRA